MRTVFTVDQFGVPAATSKFCRGTTISRQPVKSSLDVYEKWLDQFGAAILNPRIPPELFPYTHIQKSVLFAQSCTVAKVLSTAKEFWLPGLWVIWALKDPLTV